MDPLNDIPIKYLPDQPTSFAILNDKIFMANDQEMVIQIGSETLEKRAGKHQIFSNHDHVAVTNFEGDLVRVAVYFKDIQFKAKMKISYHTPIKTFKTWIQGVYSTKESILINQVRINYILGYPESLLAYYKINDKLELTLDKLVILPARCLVEVENTMVPESYGYTLIDYKDGVMTPNYRVTTPNQSVVCETPTFKCTQKCLSPPKSIEIHQDIVSYLDGQDFVCIILGKRTSIRFMDEYDVPLAKTIRDGNVYILFPTEICIFSFTSII